MNASRTRQIDAQDANRAQGRQPYQPRTAIAPRACDCLVYRTQTFDWVLDRVSCCAGRGAGGRVWPWIEAEAYARGRCARDTGRVNGRV